MNANVGGTDAPHRPVLLPETVSMLDTARGGLFIDGTRGMGGHTEAILESDADARVIGIDRDPAALEIASARLARFGERFRGVHGNFKDFQSIIGEGDSVSGFLVDLGVSSLQFDSETRGFSFRFDSPLDMRMDATSDGPTAADLLATLPEEDIANILFEYGEERRSRKIARWIVERREKGTSIRTTAALAELVARATGHRKRDQIHPATRTFQALRIAVNGELDGLATFLKSATESLQPAGRLVVISFHSLEDRVVKHEFRTLAGQCTCPPRLPQCICGARKVVEIVTRRAVVPGADEIAENPRSRSAKLRAVKKLEPEQVIK